MLSFLQSVISNDSSPEIAYNFVVMIGLDILGYFRNVDNVEMKNDVYDWKEGGRNSSPHRLPFDNPTTPGEVTLRWGTPKWSTLFDWANDVEVGKAFRKEVLIIQLRRDGWPSRIMRLSGAWPTSWKGPSLDTMSSDWAVEEVTLSYDVFNMIVLDLGLDVSSALTMMTSLVSALTQDWTSDTPSKASLVCSEKDALSVEFQFNPEKISLTMSSDWSPGGEGNGTLLPSQEYGGGKPASLSFEVMVDESEVRDAAASAIMSLLPVFASDLASLLGLEPENTNSVTWRLQQVHNLTLPHVTDSTTGQKRPPLVCFTWGGSFLFTGLVTKADVNVLLWDTDGNPRRATINLDIEGMPFDDVDASKFFKPPESSDVDSMLSDFLDGAEDPDALF